MPARCGATSSILVVEDDSEITELLNDVLGEGYAVTCVSDAPAALACIEQESPDIVLTDCLLPGGGASEIFEKAKRSGCSVVLMSGLPQALAGYEVLGFPCLCKPFRITELLRTIEAVASRRIGVQETALSDRTGLEKDDNMRALRH